MEPDPRREHASPSASLPYYGPPPTTDPFQSAAAAMPVPPGYGYPGAHDLSGRAGDGQPAYGQPAYGYPAYGQPAYGQAAYGQPAYGPPSGPMPAWGPAGGYPATAAGFAYPPMAPGWPSAGTGRPRRVMASAVLSYVLAGMLAIAALVLFGKAGVTIGHDAGPDALIQGAPAGEYLTLGLVNTVLVGLLIAAAVRLTGRHRRARKFVAVAAATSLLESLYWIVRAHEGASATWAVIFGILTVLVAVFAFAPVVTRWLDGALPPQFSQPADLPTWGWTPPAY